jgi:uncharacterized membrane protein
MKGKKMKELEKSIESLTDSAIVAIFFSVPLVMGIISMIVGN